MDKIKLRVAMVGHSQTPRNFISYDDVEVKTFSRRGAKCQDLVVSPMNGFFNWKHDITIFFIGGNDFTSRTVNEVCDDLLKMKEYLMMNSQEVFFTLCEKRVYHPDNKYYKHQTEYNRKSSKLNRKLCRLQSIKGFRIINATDRIFQEGSRDGIHMGRTAQAALIDKYKSAIKHARKRLNK